MICRVCRTGIGRRGISTGLRNAYFVKLYEKLREKWRNVVISVWIGRDHNYRTFFLFLFNALFRWGILDLVFIFRFLTLTLILSHTHSLSHMPFISPNSSFFFFPSLHAVNFLTFTHAFFHAHAFFLTLFLSLSLHTLDVPIFKGTGGPAG